MILATSPGLPPWPKLWFDSRQKRASVVVRHPTWRSYEWSYRATEVLVWLVYGLIAVGTWTTFSTPNLWLRVLFVLIAAIVCFPMAALATRTAFRDLLARQVFATQTKFWVTETSIIFKSRLYASPVVVWRTWKDKPINIKFIVQTDLDAASYLADHQQQRKWPRTPITEANVVGLVIATPNTHDGQMPTSHEDLRRSVAITEVSSRYAQKFSTVFSAAMLLVPLENVDSNASSNDGVDIDTLS